MKEKDFKQWLAQKEVDKWLSENQELVNDFIEIVNHCVMFEAKYGQKIFINFEKMKEQGRTAKETADEIIKPEEL